MPRAYTIDLRWRIVWLYTVQQLSPGEIANLACVNERTVRRYITLFEQTGDIQPALQRHGPPKLLGDFEQLVLLRLIFENPGIYLHEIQAKLLAKFGVTVSSMSSPLHSGGRRKKVAKKRGRPMKESYKGIANAILNNAPESWKVVQPLSLSRFLPPATNLTLTDFQCAICLRIVDRPVQTPCGKLLCADCISETLRSQDDFTEQDMPCLCCNGSHYVTSTSFTPASEVVLKVLGALFTRCYIPSCTAVVGLKYLKQHVESGCKITPSTFSPSKLTIGQIISRPLQSPPTSVEQKAAANVVQRLMQTSPTTDASEGNTQSSVVKLTTEDTVSIYVHDSHTCI